jgi:hypothetical protein
MATIRQIEANRRNAHKSTGPRTDAGKARSAMNALKSGIDAQSEIIPGEDGASFDALAAEYINRFQPTSPDERCLVDVLIRSDWQLRRLARAEARLWQSEIQFYDRLEAPVPHASALNSAAETLSRLQRRVDSTQRNYQRALRELESLQAARPPDPQPAENAAIPEPLPQELPSRETKPIQPAPRYPRLPPGHPDERVIMIYDPDNPDGSDPSSC